jgi:hypothetical protein
VPGHEDAFGDTHDPLKDDRDEGNDEDPQQHNVGVHSDRQQRALGSRVPGPAVKLN